MSPSAADLRIRSLRPPKQYVDPYAALGSVIEDERRPGGRIESALTVFLAGAECPFTCTFCDLWKSTIDGPTPPGALAPQLEKVLSAIQTPLPQRLKLYNASNFFDRRAVPVEDFERIADLSSDFFAVTVESHANTIGAPTFEFAKKLNGRLEVAVGLETINEVAAAQLNKRLELGRFDSAARLLLENGIDLRVFVLLGAPNIAPNEAVDWTVRTVEYAVQRGASVVSIIPVRGGNGEMERLESLGLFNPPTLSQLEEAVDRCAQFDSCVVNADLWDIERLTICSGCAANRIVRLKRINATGCVEPRVFCHLCGRE